MKKDIIEGIIIAIVAFIVMFFASTLDASAQEVKREGTVFTQLNKAAQKEAKTEYTYVDSKGNVYPVYLSSTGKAFIKKLSKKTGKEYRQYLPEVGKMINPEAYKKDKEKVAMYK